MFLQPQSLLDTSFLISPCSWLQKLIEHRGPHEVPASSLRGRKSTSKKIAATVKLFSTSWSLSDCPTSWPKKTTEPGSLTSICCLSASGWRWWKSYEDVLQSKRGLWKPVLSEHTQAIPVCPNTAKLLEYKWKRRIHNQITLGQSSNIVQGKDARGKATTCSKRAP